MQDISKQTAMQALEIYKSGIDSGKGVAVNEKTGTVRVATIFDRFASKLAIRFTNINPTVVWAESAKAHIMEKFVQEDLFLRGGQPNQNDNTELKDAVESIIAQHTASGPHPVDVRSSVMQELTNAKKPVQLALINILAAHDNTTHKTSRFFWQAISRQQNLDIAPDIAFACAVADNASKWKREIGLSSEQALKLAYDAQSLHTEQGIPPETGMKVLQNAGRLVNGHGLKPSDALQFAIDIHPLLGEMQLTLGAITSLANLLEARKAIPTGLPEKTRLSAAICYLQQRDDSKSDEVAIGIIKQRLERKAFIDSKLPRGCTKDCIHQGAHIRTTYKLDQNQLEDFKKRTETLNNYPIEHDKKVLIKAAKFGNLDPQFGIDATRAPFSASRAGKPDSSFTKLELQKQTLNVKFKNEQLSKWLDSYIDFAGGENASKVLSRFTSQTIFGDVTTHSARATRTLHNLLCFSQSKQGGTTFIYKMNRIDVSGKERIDLHNTAMFNASGLTIDQGFAASDTFDPAIEQYTLPLVPNAGEEKASERTYSVRYDFKASLSRADLDADRTTCTPLEVSVAYDLILDEAELDRRQENGEDMTVVSP